MSEQVDSELPLEAQQLKLRQYAELNDLEIVVEIVDAGESAKSLKRPGIQQALEMLRNGETDGIVVTKLDRLPRSMTDWQALITEFFSEKQGKELFSHAHSIDTRTAAGRLVLNVLVPVAAWERETVFDKAKQ